MSEKWYYVRGNEKVGPIEKSEIEGLFNKGVILKDSYVWTQGMENWTILEEVKNFSNLFSKGPPELPIKAPAKSFDWNKVDEKSPIFSIKIGPDRGSEEKILDQWFSIEQIIKFAAEKRINEKTLIFTMGMEEFMPLGEVPLREKIFPNLTPDQFKPVERRKNERSPVLARIFFENEKNFHEGICINLSEGGMKVLINNFPGKVGGQISMNVHKENPDVSFTASGTIVSVPEDKSGFSLKFKDLNQETKSTIRSFLKNQ